MFDSNFSLETYAANLYMTDFDIFIHICIYSGRQKTKVSCADITSQLNLINFFRLVLYSIFENKAVPKIMSTIFILFCNDVCSCWHNFSNATIKIYVHHMRKHSSKRFLSVNCNRKFCNAIVSELWIRTLIFWLGIDLNSRNSYKGRWPSAISRKHICTRYRKFLIIVQSRQGFIKWSKTFLP